MNKLKITLKDRGEILVDKGAEIKKVIDKYYPNEKVPIVLAKINDKIYELRNKIQFEGEFEPINIGVKLGQKVYSRTLQFVMIKAAYDLWPNCVVDIQHSLCKGSYCEIHKEPKLTKNDVNLLRIRMQEIINQDIPIKKEAITKKEAIELFNKNGMKKKVRFLKHINVENLKIYKLDNIYDYFYGPMAYSTGSLNLFEIFYYSPGLMLRYPREENPLVIPPYVNYKKLRNIFKESKQWAQILDIGDVGALNDKVDSGNIVDYIRISEALHEKKIAYIADEISERKETKMVLIAGPSSSGKTTFAKRLAIQLRVNGLMPTPVSLDDYFLDREHTPRDENGNYDFESIYALDLELFNKNLIELLSGKEAEIPTFDFKTGNRIWSGEKISLPDNGILIIEGIHGLNEILTSSIPKERKFKVYISALTQLNLDNHNRISTTDVRLIRRIVRDYLSRGYSAKSNLEMWPSVRRGEDKNIFVYQEEADAMFNSTLVYELCVLKDYALEVLKKVNKGTKVYFEALRLMSFLHFFKSVDAKYVPENSIIREFIGGSCFYKY